MLVTLICEVIFEKNCDNCKEIFNGYEERGYNNYKLLRDLVKKGEFSFIAGSCHLDDIEYHMEREDLYTIEHYFGCKCGLIYYTGFCVRGRPIVKIIEKLPKSICKIMSGHYGIFLINLNNKKYIGGKKMKLAFLIIDMQNGCREMTQCKRQFDIALEYINGISELFRNRNLPVVVIKDVDVGAPGSDEFECVENLTVCETDIVVHKKYSNSFWETELDDILKKEGVDGVLISGFAAEHCVVFTYNGALERGYNTFLLQHGVAGFNEDEIKKIQQLRPVVSYEAIEYFI